MSDTYVGADLGSSPYVQWSPVIGGALAAAALANVFHAFALAVGLAISSTSPTWRDASIGLSILSAVYVLLAALASYGLGGYVAGLLRTRAVAASRADEIETRDHLHGLLVWALATVVTAMFILWAGAAETRVIAPSGGANGPSASVAGDSTIALDLDRALRTTGRAGATTDAMDTASLRAEVSRILLTASGHRGVLPDDRAYLIDLIGSRTGLPPAQATARADRAIVDAKENLSKARKIGILIGFAAGASVLLGAVAAWVAAAAGGLHRDDTREEWRPNILGRRRAL